MTEFLCWTFRPSNAAQLKQCVEDAFADAIYPGNGDRDIVVSGCPGCCAECGETHALFRGKHWRELAGSGEPLLTCCWGGLPLLTAAAWRFYLPAYLLRSLSGGDDAEDCLTSALYSLAPSMPEPGRHDFDTERYSGLTAAQQKCIAAYAHTAVEAGGDDAAFDRASAFWNAKVYKAHAAQGAA